MPGHSFSLIRVKVESMRDRRYVGWGNVFQAEGQGVDQQRCDTWNGFLFRLILNDIAFCVHGDEIWPPHGSGHDGDGRRKQ